jgi:hypothetical protein
MVNDLQITSIFSTPIAEVLSVLDEVFGPGHDQTWFAWKHVDNPWGPSFGWVAIDRTGVVGVRLFMPWELTINERRIRAVRPVDTAVVQRARGRGVFRELTSHAIAAVTNDPDVQLIFSTPNENSRPAYAAMGWSVLEAIAHGARPVMPGRIASLDHTDAAFDAFDYPVAKSDRLSTLRNARVMRWRYSARSGLSYATARLRSGEAPNAIVYRIVARLGVRFLVVEELAGTINDRHLLVRSVARHEGARALLFSRGSGALEVIPGVALRCGASVLAVRLVKEIAADPTRLECWALTIGDLEHVI